MIDVIMPVKGGAKVVQEAVDSLFEKTPPGSFRLIMMADDDDKELAPFFEGWRARGVSVVIGPDPKGFSLKVMAGVHLAATPFVGLMNSDIVLDTDCFTPMAGHLADDPKVAIVGAKLLHGRDRDGGKRGTINHAGCDPHPRAIMLHVGMGEPRVRFPYCREVFANTFALVVIRRDLLLQPLDTPDGPMTGLDPTTGWAGVEDADFCVRCVYNGYTNVCCADAVAYHQVSYHRGDLRMNVAMYNQFARNADRAAKRWGEFIERSVIGRISGQA